MENGPAAVIAEGVKLSLRENSLRDPLLLSFALVLAAFFYLPHTLNHDTSWYLISTSWWLDGARLYRDIVEINPPMAFFLTVPAVLASRLSGLNSTSTYIIFMLALILVSLLWFRRIMRMTPALSSRQQSIMLAGGYIALCVTTVENFGQREPSLAKVASN